jgi:hypothetical protein
MVKKGKTRAKAGGGRETPPRGPDESRPIEPEAAPTLDTEATPDLAAPEGARKEEAELAPERVPDGGEKMHPSAAPRRVPEGADDKDLNVRSIVGFVTGIFALLGVAATVSWGIYIYIRGDLRAMDPPPSPIPEANEPVLPPEPRLRESPPADMDALRARENAVLTTYGWVDRGSGIGRVPIERAIDLAAEGKTAAKTEGDKP